jgi:hypothetical protein
MIALGNFPSVRYNQIICVRVFLYRIKPMHMEVNNEAAIRQHGEGEGAGKKDSEQAGGILAVIFGWRFCRILRNFAKSKIP